MAAVKTSIVLIQLNPGKNDIAYERYYKINSKAIKV
jgi:hypothetical protein